MGLLHDLAAFGGANRRLSTGGWAKGMPRNLLTLTVEEGTEVWTPTITPLAIVADGAAERAEVHNAPRTRRLETCFIFAEVEVETERTRKGKVGRSEGVLRGALCWQGKWRPWWMSTVPRREHVSWTRLLETSHRADFEKRDRMAAHAECTGIASASVPVKRGPAEQQGASLAHRLG